MDQTTNQDQTKGRPLREMGWLTNRLNVNDSWVYSKCSTNEFPHIRVGRYLRFDEIEVERWIEERRHGHGESVTTEHPGPARRRGRPRGRTSREQ